MANPLSQCVRNEMGFAMLPPTEIKMCHVCCGHRSGTCLDGPSESLLAARYSMYIPINVTNTSQVAAVVLPQTLEIYHYERQPATIMASVQVASTA